MDSSGMPTKMVGNDFFVPTPRAQAMTPIVAAEASIPMPLFGLTDSVTLDYELEAIPAYKQYRFKKLHKLVDFAHIYSVGTFAAMFLIVGSGATLVAGNYISTRIESSAPTIRFTRSAQPLAGPNFSLPTKDLSAKMSAITAQSIAVQIGVETETIPSETISGWISVASDKATNTSYIHVNSQKVTSSIKELAANFGN